MLKLFRYLKPYKQWIAGILGLVFLQAMAELYLPNLMALIINNGVLAGNTGYILKIGAFMLLVAAGGSLCAIAANYLAARLSSSYGRDLRERVFTRVEAYSLKEFDQVGTATLITRTTNDISQIQQLLVIMMRMMILAPMMAIGGIIMAVSKDRGLSNILVIILPILTGTILIVGYKGIPLFKIMQTKLDKLNLVLRENLTGIRVIRAFNRTDYEKKRFNAANKDLTDTAIFVNRLIAVLMPSMMLFMNLTSVAIIWFGGLRIDAGQLSLGDMMAFIQYTTQILISLVMVSIMFVMIPRASASAARINEVLELETAVNDPQHPKDAQDKRGYVEFKNVSFYYGDAEQPALKDISFTAGPGEITAIIGGTGSGKSTLLNLIPRFYDVSEGQVLVNGVDVREMSQQALRSKIGYVPQKAVLFSGTVAENIRYGKETASEAEVVQAAQVAQAADFIGNMEAGYDSVISQGGTNVSGGQKQRLSIARTLVRKPEIYLFDDSFSALDFKTDAKLRAALSHETKDATVIIVAQRVSTIMNADRIIVLHGGEIVGMGTHRQLLAENEVYREIVSSQLSEEELA